MPGINGINPNDPTRRMNYIQRQSNDSQEQQSITDESSNNQTYNPSNQETLSQQLANMAAINVANIIPTNPGDILAQQLGTYITCPVSPESQARISNTSLAVAAGIKELTRLGFSPEQAAQLVNITMGKLL